ncbi:MAG: hypothetical protein WAW96_11455 [Alphaproteobacteria bacterium]
MTDLLKKAFEAIQKWPSERQNEAAEMLLALDRLGGSAYTPSDDELTAIDEALAQGACGEIASDEEVAAAFAKFRKS